MRLRKKENNELRDLNDQISLNSCLIKRYTDENSLNMITRELDLMIASRLRRYMILLDKRMHPISNLQERLGAGEHLRQLAKLNIYSVTNTSLQTLYKIELKNYMRDIWLMDMDGVLQNRFMHTKIKHAIADTGIGALSTTFSDYKG